MDVIEKYSKNDLREFEKIILKKLKTAEDDLKFYGGKKEDDNGTDDTSVGFKPFEEVSSTVIRGEDQRLAMRQEKFIRDLKNALVRIKNGTYGICHKTGKKIPKERLLLVPHATMTVEAKQAS